MARSTYDRYENRYLCERKWRAYASFCKQSRNISRLEVVIFHRMSHTTNRMRTIIAIAFFPLFKPENQNLSPVSGMSPSYQQSEPSPTTLGNNQQQTLQYMIQTQQRQQQLQQQQQQQQQHNPQHQPAQTGLAGPSPPNTPTSCPATPSTMMGQLMGALNNSALLDDLNINIETMQGFNCNVEEVSLAAPCLLLTVAFMLPGFPQIEFFAWFEMKWDWTH